MHTLYDSETFSVTHMLANAEVAAQRPSGASKSEHAAQALPMLARGAPVSQVASASGYTSDSAFSAMFKQAMGKAPSFFQSKSLPR